MATAIRRMITFWQSTTASGDRDWLRIDERAARTQYRRDKQLASRNRREHDQASRAGDRDPLR